MDCQTQTPAIPERYPIAASTPAKRWCYTTQISVEANWTQSAPTLGRNFVRGLACPHRPGFRTVGRGRPLGRARIFTGAEAGAWGPKIFQAGAGVIGNTGNRGRGKESIFLGFLMQNSSQFK